MILKVDKIKERLEITISRGISRFSYNKKKRKMTVLQSKTNNE